jgi:hypothetical protein
MYWDGLLRRILPFGIFQTLPGARVRSRSTFPVELWIIMINSLRQEREPKRMDDIRDYRKLTANISFPQ